MLLVLTNIAENKLSFFYVIIFTVFFCRDYLTKYLPDACSDEGDKVWLPAESTSHAIASLVKKVGVQSPLVSELGK